MAKTSWGVEIEFAEVAEAHEDILAGLTGEHAHSRFMDSTGRNIQWTYTTEGTMANPAQPNEDEMKDFKHRGFTKRDYEYTNIVACVGHAAPSEEYERTDAAILTGLTKLWIQSGVAYYGYL